MKRDDANRVETTQGNKAHTWLTQAEVKQMMDSWGTSTIHGQRDKIVLGLLVEAGSRRTYAQLGYETGVPVTQISRLLGHASVATTQRYLNLDLDLKTTVSDFIPF